MLPNADNRGLNAKRLKAFRCGAGSTWYVMWQRKKKWTTCAVGKTAKLVKVHHNLVIGASKGTLEPPKKTFEKSAEVLCLSTHNMHRFLRLPGDVAWFTDLLKLDNLEMLASLNK